MNLKDRLSHVRSLGGILHGGRAFGGPFFANIWLINRCNIRCMHCPFFSPEIENPIPYSVRRERLKGANLSEKRHRELVNEHEHQRDADGKRTCSVIDDLLKMGTRRFFFTGSGEPFLHKDILDFMGRVKKAGSSCVVYTNGTLLNPGKIDEIIAMKADELRVSIMAGTRDTYMRTHVGIRDDTFDTLRDNLLYLKEQKAAKGMKRPFITLINVITSLNYQGLYDFIEFAHQVGADKVSFQPFDTFNDQALSKMELTDEQARSVREQLVESKTFLSSGSIINNADIFLKFFQKKLDTMELYHIIPCYIGWLGIRLQLNGEVNLCCRCYEPLGNIFSESIEEIWHGKSYKMFRKEAFEINKRGTTVQGCDCNTCPHYALNLKVYQALHPFKGRKAELNTYVERPD